MSNRKRDVKTKTARARLTSAISAAIFWKGRSEFIEGYRAGKLRHDPAETDRMEKPGRDALNSAADAHKRMKTALAAYTRAVRAEAHEK